MTDAECNALLDKMFPEPEQKAETFAAIPDLLDEAEPESSIAPGDWRNRLLSLERIILLADFAAENPQAWKVCRLHYFCPDLTSDQIAGFVGTNRRNVNRWLSTQLIGDDMYKNLPTEK